MTQVSKGVVLATALMLASAPALARDAGDPPLAETGETAARPLPPLAGGARFAASDGVRLWYRDTRPAGGVPVVFLHGGPGQGSMVLQGAGGPDLAKRVRLVYFDQRGAGRSERPDDPARYSVERIAADLDELRQRLGVEQLVLFGHSAGTVFALEYARRHPERVAGLVLAGAVPDIPAAMEQLCTRLERAGGEPWHKARAAAAPGRRCDPFQAYDGADNQRWINRNMFPDPRTAARVEALDQKDGLQNSGQMGNALWESLFKNYRFDAPERLTMPVLVIDGARDDQTDEVSQQVLVKTLRAGRYQAYRGAGHFPFVDQPRRFARDVAAFVRSLGRRRAS